MFGSTPLVQLAPASVLVAYPTPDPPPSKNRPTCVATTIVFPYANVSGSTAAACWLLGFVNGSAITLVMAADAGVAATNDPTVAATASLDARADMNSLPSGVGEPTLTTRRGLAQRSR